MDDETMSLLFMFQPKDATNVCRGEAGMKAYTLWPQKANY